MDSTKAATARKVDAAREGAGLSISELAVASGIPYATLHRKLRAQSPFDFDDIDRLAAALSTTPRDLIAFEDAA
jgi:transcriptional regulator with XRE-family HTH domain